MPPPASSSKLILPPLTLPDGRRKAVEFSVFGAAAPPSASPALTAASCLIPCMANRRRLDLPGPLDATLAAALPKLMNLLAEWNPKLHPVTVAAPAVEKNPPPPKSGRGVAACFTGGVDSFYTLETRREEIDTLVYVLGYDLQRKQAALWDQVQAMLEKVAAHYQKRLVVVETNLRSVLDEFLPWGMTHGTALAAAGHLLSGEIRRLIIPASFSTAQLHPWGSHPDLDPLWSSGDLEIIHDSTVPTRLEKLRTLAAAGTPLEHLRVCWENPDQAYNCGSCAKCFRTMAGLAALGALEKAPVFPSRPDMAAAARLDLGDETDGLFLAEVREELAATGREPELAAFLAKLPAANRPSAVPFSLLRHQNRLQGEPLVINAATIEVDDERTRLSVPVQWGKLETRLKVEFDLGGAAPEVVGDALLLWFILPAMNSKVPLVLEDAVSAELRRTIDKAQGLWSTHWAFEGHSHVDVRAPVAPPPSHLPPRPWASAFSSGVDAIFTAMTESSRIQYLVWIQGMDSDAIDPAENERTHRWMQEGAAALGKRLVTVRSNLRRVLFRELGLNWPFMYVMSPYGLAQLMQAHTAGMFIAAELSYAEMFSKTAALRYHPILDPWLSTLRVAIKVHGMTHDRSQKVAAICQKPELLGKLVVCQQRAMRGFAGGRNCGTCEKCQRTLMAIRMAGAAHPAEAFDHPLDLGFFRNAAKAVPLIISRLQYYQTMEQRLRRDASDPELLELLSPLVRRAEKKQGLVTGDISLEALRSDQDWPEQLRSHSSVLAEAVLSDKPSARLKALMEKPPSEALGAELLHALLREEGRGRMARRVLGKVLRGDLRGGEK